MRAVAALALIVVTGCSGGSRATDASDGGGATHGPVGTRVSDGGSGAGQQGAGGAGDDGGETSPGDPMDATVGDDAATTPDASAFVVAQVPGLVLWLDAARGVTFHGANYVLRWADQSGQHNDCIAGETHMVEEPQQITAAINDLPAMHFNPGTYGGDSGIPPNCDGEDCGAGDNFMITDSPSLQWGTGDFLIEVLARYSNSDPRSPEYTYAGTFFFRSAGNGPWFRGNSYPETPSTGLSALLSSKEGGDVNELVTATTHYNDGQARLLAMQRVGTVVSIRVNGRQTDSKTFASALDVTGDGGTADNPTLVTIGASYSDVSRLDGDIAELLAVKGTLAPNDLAGIEGYLMSKYGL